MSSVTISVTARGPADEPGRVTRTNASLGRRCDASDHRPAVAAAMASGVASASSALGTPA